jgi:CheY-like chemotaxis protein
MPSRQTSVPDRDQLLVVEDDAAQRVGLQQLLKSWGYAVEVASDGREAIEKAATLRPTVVLSDLVMPGMGGLDLLRALAPTTTAATSRWFS